MCFKVILYSLLRKLKIKTTRNQDNIVLPCNKDIVLRDTIQDLLLKLNCLLNEMRNNTEGKDYLIHLLCNKINEYNKILARNEEVTMMCKNIKDLYLRANKMNEINKNKIRFSEEYDILINGSNKNSQVMVTAIPKNNNIENN